VPEKKAVVEAEADADEDIPHPTFEVYRHTLLRGANLGGVLSLVLGPPVLFVRGVRKPSEMLARLAGVCVKGVVSCSRYSMHAHATCMYDVPCIWPCKWKAWYQRR
jgi:hypothetical protein